MRILPFILLCCLYSTATFADTQLILILDWFINPDHAPLLVAEQQGYFREEGLDVKMIQPGNPSEPAKIVAAQKADIAITYEPLFVKQQAAGLPLIKIATLIATPLDCLVVNANSHIYSVADLKGKKIGYSTDTSSLVMLQAMLHHAGLNSKDVDLINVHYNLSQALLTGKVDAITSVMRNIEVTQLQLAGFKARVFYPEENGIPAYDELILVAHREHAKRLPLKKFTRALEKGTQYLINHPEETWHLFAKNHPELNNELNHRAWLDTLPRFALRPAARDSEREKRVAQFFSSF